MAAPLTIFTIPKPFVGTALEDQRRALRSWRELGAEVLVFGDDEGVAHEAAEVGARHVTEIARTDLGTPLVSDAFERAADLASTPVLAYANADMLLADDLPRALGRVGLPRFLLVGRRREQDGTLGTPFQIDWFAWPRSLRWDLPPFAVGRPAWDNWLIGRARALGVPVVDGTAAVHAVHQTHGYGHVPGATGPGWEGPEADRNRELAAGVDRLCILDASHVLDERGLRRALGGPYLRRRLFRLAERTPVTRHLAAALGRR
jgi:hypothetical protein